MKCSNPDCKNGYDYSNAQFNVNKTLAWEDVVICSNCNGTGQQPEKINEMDDSKLKLKIRDAFERSYPMPAGYQYDFNKNIYTDDKGTMYVLLTAVYHEYVKGYFKCLEDTGLLDGI